MKFIFLQADLEGVAYWNRTGWVGVVLAFCTGAIWIWTFYGQRTKMKSEKKRKTGQRQTRYKDSKRQKVIFHFLNRNCLIYIFITLVIDRITLKLIISF